MPKHKELGRLKNLQVKNLPEFQLAEVEGTRLSQYLQMCDHMANGMKIIGKTLVLCKFK